MSRRQWGHGYHTGVRDTLKVVGVAIVALAAVGGVIWLVKRDKKENAEIQQPTSGTFTLQQPTYQY